MRKGLSLSIRSVVIIVVGVAVVLIVALLLSNQIDSFTMFGTNKTSQNLTNFLA